MAESSASAILGRYSYPIQVRPIAIDFDFTSGVYDAAKVRFDLQAVESSSLPFLEMLNDIPAGSISGVNKIVVTDDLSKFPGLTGIGGLTQGEANVTLAGVHYVYLSPDIKNTYPGTTQEIPVAQQIVHGIAHATNTVKEAETGIFFSEEARREAGENAVYATENAIFESLGFPTVGSQAGQEERVEGEKPAYFADSPEARERCFAAGTPIEMADGSTKPIEDIKLGDKILAFDGDADGGRGAKVARRVTQLHRTENQPLINFHGTKVTPGHAYLTGEGSFLPIIEILQNDGTVVMSDGKVIRARTGWPVDSREDRAIPVGYPDGGTIKLTTMRAGTLYGGKDGKAYTIEQMMNSRGYHMMSDGRFVGVEGDIKTAYWEWGAPDDKLIAGKYASYADLVEGSAIGIGMPLVPSRPN